MRRAVIVAFALVVVGIISVALKEGRWNRLSDAEKAAAMPPVTVRSSFV